MTPTISHAKARVVIGWRTRLAEQIAHTAAAVMSSTHRPLTEREKAELRAQHPDGMNGPRAILKTADSKTYLAQIARICARRADPELAEQLDTLRREQHSRGQARRRAPGDLEAARARKIARDRDRYKRDRDTILKRQRAYRRTEKYRSWRAQYKKEQRSRSDLAP